MIVLLGLVFLAIIAFEVPGMLKKQQWRELAAFSVLMLIAMALSFAQLLGLPVPNPTPVIEAIFEPVSEAVKKLLS
ncbi:MAG: hypothetical protein CVU89_02500 [Firmicutes bacterium HGW-Firmicutes-14]|nr:MAG: hypothetical protein CVU89_02500 [Firmicutes bacterium HGW-Firmicutes-14]